MPSMKKLERLFRQLEISEETVLVSKHVPGTWEMITMQLSKETDTFWSVDSDNLILLVELYLEPPGPPVTISKAQYRFILRVLTAVIEEGGETIGLEQLIEFAEEALTPVRA